jgi:uncharacterized protein YndB with AHSA1/START domain
MDFKVGGRRFYKMESPEGQEHFSVQDYASIYPKTNLEYISGFSEKDENINPEFYGSENTWILVFMALIHPYLHFNGNAEEAFKFYKSVFGGEFACRKRNSMHY